MCQIMEDLREETAGKTAAKMLVEMVENTASNLGKSIEDACKIVGHTFAEYEAAKELLKRSAWPNKNSPKPSKAARRPFSIRLSSAFFLQVSSQIRTTRKMQTLSFSWL